MTSLSYRPLAVALLVSTNMFAQTQLTGLNEPAALTVHGDSGHAFIFEAGTGRLLRWNRKETSTLLNEIISKSSFTSIRTLCFREGNLLTVIGTSGYQVRVGTYSVDVLGPATAEKGLTGELELDSPTKTIAAACATDFAIYLAVGDVGGNQNVWRVPAGRTSLGKPVLLIEEVSDAISSMTFSPGGHVVLNLATENDGDQLQFHHAETGRLLLKLDSDLREVTSIAYSPSGLLYAVGSKLKRNGVFRLDVFLDAARQTVHATEIAKLDKIVGLEFSDKGDCVVLVGGRQDGRALTINAH